MAFGKKSLLSLGLLTSILLSPSSTPSCEEHPLHMDEISLQGKIELTKEESQEPKQEIRHNYDGLPEEDRRQYPPSCNSNNCRSSCECGPHKISCCDL